MSFDPNIPPTGQSNPLQADTSTNPPSVSDSLTQLMLRHFGTAFTDQQTSSPFNIHNSSVVPPDAAPLPMSPHDYFSAAAPLPHHSTSAHSSQQQPGDLLTMEHFQFFNEFPISSWEQSPPFPVDPVSLHLPQEVTELSFTFLPSTVPAAVSQPPPRLKAHAPRRQRPPRGTSIGPSPLSQLLTSPAHLPAHPTSSTSAPSPRAQQHPSFVTSTPIPQARSDLNIANFSITNPNWDLKQADYPVITMAQGKGAPGRYVCVKGNLIMKGRIPVFEQNDAINLITGGEIANSTLFCTQKLIAPVIRLQSNGAIMISPTATIETNQLDIWTTRILAVPSTFFLTLRPLTRIQCEELLLLQSDDSPQLSELALRQYLEKTGAFVEFPKKIGYISQAEFNKAYNDLHPPPPMTTA